MKKILLMLPMVLLIFGCKDESNNNKILPTSVSYIQVKSTPVKLKKELSGIVSSYLISEVRPQVSGIIKQRLFEEGSYVKEGQILYKVDPILYNEKYNQSLATLSSAEANYKSINNKYNRYKVLKDKNIISKQDLDDVESSAKIALANIEQEKSNLEIAKINLERTEIKAPISGYIGLSSVTVGALVGDSQSTPLAIIRQINPIYIDISQSSLDLLYLNKMFYNDKNIEKGNQNIEIILEDNTVFNEIGKLKFSEHNIDSETGSINIRAEVENKNHILLPGMYVKAIINEAINNNGILIPQRAVQRNSKAEPYVYILTDKNTVEQRLIVIERAIDNNWLLKDGLKEDEKIVIEGLNKIKSGMTVSPSLFDQIN